jgi:hypothetical protein
MPSAHGEKMTTEELAIAQKSLMDSTKRPYEANWKVPFYKNGRDIGISHDEMLLAAQTLNDATRLDRYLEGRKAGIPHSGLYNAVKNSTYFGMDKYIWENTPKPKIPERPILPGDKIDIAFTANFIMYKGYGYLPGPFLVQKVRADGGLVVRQSEGGFTLDNLIPSIIDKNIEVPADCIRSIAKLQ